ncbi:hypothetical protein LINGRAHAP2_LOCUS17950, partial [Linum grandiflorum]
ALVRIVGIVITSSINCIPQSSENTPSTGLLPNCSDSSLFRVLIPNVPLCLKCIKNMQNNVIRPRGPDGNKTHRIFLENTQWKQSWQSKCCIE